jgi:hypothetical protein
MKTEILLTNVAYDPISGLLTNKRNNRLLIPDVDGFIYYSQTTPVKAQIKIKANRLCCLLGFGKIIEKNQRVLHKNLNENDFRLTNLAIVSSTEYKKINEARTNIDSRLRLVAHPEDQLSYFLHWREDGIDKRELILDIVVARRKLKKLQLKYSKILSKYCIFD